MFRYILEKWKARKNILFVMIIGFSVSSLFLSVGISVSIDNYNRLQDITSGNPDDQALVEVFLQDQHFESADYVIEKLSKYGEVQIVSLLPIAISGISVQPVLVENPGMANWHIPIIKGDYLSGAPQEIVIGCELAKAFRLSPGDHFEINGQSFSVVGIAGRSKRPTQWDNCLYLGWENYSMLFNEEELQNRRRLGILLKSGKEIFIRDFKEIEKECDLAGIEIFYENLEGQIDRSSLKNTVLITVTGFVTILIVTMINTFNLMYYWQLERRKDLALLRAMGVTIKDLTKSLSIEISMIYLMGGITAFILQYIFTAIFDRILEKNNIYIEIGFSNIFIAFIVSAIVGISSSLIMSKKSFAFEPADLLKEDS